MHIWMHEKEQYRKKAPNLASFCNLLSASWQQIEVWHKIFSLVNPNGVFGNYGWNQKSEQSAYPVLVDDIDNNDEISIVFPIVDEGDPSDFHVSLERLQTNTNNHHRHMIHTLSVSICTWTYYNTYAFTFTFTGTKKLSSSRSHHCFRQSKLAGRTAKNRLEGWGRRSDKIRVCKTRGIVEFPSPF